jgi:curved DNA-binding protein CbpA
MKDYYAILHVLPSAEIDVIKAAYKALARKYHPDTFDGDKAYASKRMQEINDAFGVIGDPDKRKKYDAERKATNQEDEFTSNGEENDAQLEADWNVACKYCPEAVASFEHLNKLSRSLAFAFKSYLLDSKQFSECSKIRDKFRAEYLKNYFGSDPVVQTIGERLVLAGELISAKTVNRAVKVMGKSLDAKSLINTLKTDYPNIKTVQNINSQTTIAQKLFLKITNNSYPAYSEIDKLLDVLNIPYEETFWGNYIITYQGNKTTVRSDLMREWITNNLGNHPDILSI